MGNLTAYLQQEFHRLRPAGWNCVPEAGLLPATLAGQLGYEPRADVVLSNPAANARVWVEFEVSRADPVANHAKFATAHLFHPQTPADHFVAMLSPHIDRGRRNLSAAAVRLMRRVGMSAFQTTLLPLATPSEVKRLNHLSPDALAAEPLDIGAEVERVLTVIAPVGRWGRVDVHLVGDLFEVVQNLRGWNDDLRTEGGRRAWGKRAVTYFVYDPTTGSFAPSKFCAYTPVLPEADWHRMTAAAYADLNDGTHVMDGQRAWKHLTQSLGMRTATAPEAGRVGAEFDRWLDEHTTAVTVRGGVPTFIVPPSWYAPLPT
ncbi:MAG: hypothetical protein K2X82_10305 [Gemmataceae bacterium]|nr:hypothetical protein [Gemmataceae bacterium]